MNLIRKIKSNPLKSLWIIWLILALTSTSVLGVLDLAIHAPELPVKLSEGATLKWQVWRPFATEDSHFEMAYHRAADGDLRLQVLGDKGQNIVGEPVVITLSVNGASCEYQQNDVTGWNDWVFRPLEPLQAACRLPEQVGSNEWSATITQVSPKLLGESTRLGMISPAGTLKYRADNVYGTMAEILFWGKLVWLPFFLFMSLPLWLDGLYRLAKQYRWAEKCQAAWQQFMWNLRHKW